MCRTTEETVESIRCLEPDENNLQHPPLWRFISWVIFACWWMVKLLTSVASPRRKPKLLIKLLALQPNHQLHREQRVDEVVWVRV